MGRIRTDGFYSYRWRSEYPDTLLVLYADGSAWCDGYAFRYDVAGDTLRLYSLVKKRKGPVKEEYIITPDSVLNFLYRKRPDISRDAKFIKGQTPPSPFQMPEKYWKSRMAIDFNLADIFPFCSLSHKKYNTECDTANLLRKDGFYERKLYAQGNNALGDSVSDIYTLERLYFSPKGIYCFMSYRFGELDWAESAYYQVDGKHICIDGREYKVMQVLNDSVVSVFFIETTGLTRAHEFTDIKEYYGHAIYNEVFRFAPADTNGIDRFVYRKL